MRLSRTKPNALFVLDPAVMGDVYGPAQRDAIESLTNVIAPPLSTAEARNRTDLLAQAEVLFSSWGGPALDTAFLEAAPRLQIVFHGAGSTNLIMTDAAYARGVRITSAYAANAIPVAEYTLATTLFSLKRGWTFARQTHQRRSFVPHVPVPGAYRSTVGLVSLGMIGQTVAELLSHFDLRVIAFDPHPRQSPPANVEMVDLQTLFEQADVVSIHSPLLPETVRQVRGRHIAAMRPNATLINTARGEIIHEPELIEVLRQRPDLHAVLDVTSPEPPAPDSPLFDLPNVTLTPHIAGSMSHECRRMGRYMVDELRRYLADEPLKWEITPSIAASSSHRPRTAGAAAAPLG